MRLFRQAEIAESDVLSGARCFPIPLHFKYVSPSQLNDSMSLFVFEVNKNKDGSKYSANSAHGLACSIQRYQNTRYCVQLKMHIIRG